MCALYLYSLFVTKLVKLETLTYTHHIYDHVNHAFCFYNLLVTTVHESWLRFKKMVL